MKNYHEIISILVSEYKFKNGKNLNIEYKQGSIIF